MSLSVSFRRSARTEFIEAAARYEGERQNLGVEFIAEIERCVTAALTVDWTGRKCSQYAPPQSGQERTPARGYGRLIRSVRRSRTHPVLLQKIYEGAYLWQKQAGARG
jgi:hypothetical protein